MIYNRYGYHDDDDDGSDRYGYDDDDDDNSVSKDDE